MKFFLLSFIFCYSAVAGDITRISYPNFKYEDGLAVFVDFKKAEYKIVIDFDKNTSFVTSTIDFYQEEDGYPIFDSHNSILDAKIDGYSVKTSTVSPPGSDTSIKVVNKLIHKGSHRLVVKSDLDETMMRMNFVEKYLDYDFLFSDLADREFLELYAVSSFEYDQVEMTFDLLIKGSSFNHVILTNGEVVQIKDNHFRISYPHYFNTSSIFLHIFKANLHSTTSFTFRSVSGRDIPVTIYVDDPSILKEDPQLLEWSKNETISVLMELENVIAPWPHPELIINMGGGGMEAQGAAHAERDSLKHEIIHSYFGRGVMPLDGKSSWIDESLTYWIEEGYPEASTCSEEWRIGLSQLSPYFRHTPENAMIFNNFAACLNYKFSAKGGLKKFLPYFFNKYKFNLITTDVLKAELENFYATDLTNDFAKYVY